MEARNAARAAVRPAFRTQISAVTLTRNKAYDRKLINQLYAVRNVYVDERGWPNLKTRYAAEQRDAFRELEGEKP